jgi:hypothetical protein
MFLMTGCLARWASTDLETCRKGATMPTDETGIGLSGQVGSGRNPRPERLPPGTGIALGVILGTTAWATILAFVFR